MNTSHIRKKIFPFLTWTHLVTKHSIKSDVIAGLIGAIIVLPQAVAFATIAGLPPQYGLYAAMIPAAIAALWGSSRHLVSGPTTAISLVVFASLSSLTNPNNPEFISYAITLALMVGILQFLLGIFKLGTLVRLISPSVVVGFTAGAGLLIMTSQIKNALGIKTPQGTDFLGTWVHVFTHLSEVNQYVLIVTVATLLTGLVFRLWLPKIPYMVPAILIGSFVGAFLNTKFGVGFTHINTIGAIPNTLPSFSFPLFNPETIKLLATSALTITILGLTEAVAIARSVGVKSGQVINGNQEFIGQGLSNIVGSFFSAYPSSGSFNRTGLNFEAGAQTPMASVFAAGILAIFVVFITPFAAYLPLATMSAILFLVAWGIIDRHHIKQILTQDKSEAMILAVTFFSTLFIELEFAILVGVLLSLTLFVRRVMFAKVIEVGESSVTGALRSLQHNEDIIRYPHTLIVRIDMSLVYMNCDVVVESILRLLAKDQSKQDNEITRVILNMSGVNYIDISGIAAVKHLEKVLTLDGVRLTFINAKHQIREAFTEHGILPRLTLYPNLTDARTDSTTK